MTSLSRHKCKVGLNLHLSPQLQPCSPCPFGQQPPRLPAKDVDIHIIMQIALHSIKNATIVTLKAILLLYAGNQSQIGDLITLIDLVPEAGQGDQAPEHPLDGARDLKAEEDSPTEAPAVTETVATVGALIRPPQQKVPEMKQVQPNTI